MKVAILTNELNYTDGVSNHIFDLIQGFQDSISHVEFIIITGKNNAPEKFKELGVEIITLKGFRHAERSAWNFIICLSKLIKIIKSKNISILHSHNHYHANIATVCKYFAPVHTVQTNHGILKKEGRLPHFIADRFIIINQHIIDFFQSECKEKLLRASFIRCGVPYKKAEMPVHDKLVFIAAGRFVLEKGFDLYIRAIHALPSELIQNCEFQLAGHGSEEKALRNLNDALGGRVTFLGNVPDLQQYLFKTDILINPSRSLSEGFPRTLVEAAYANNLIITSDFLGLKHDFINGTDGLVFEVEKIDELIQLMTRCILENSGIHILAQNFHAKAREIFSIEHMVEKTLRVYRELITS